MPSFDVVSNVDIQEVDNAVNQVSKEIAQRFDFRGGNSSIELDRQNEVIKIQADDDMKLRSIRSILEQRLAKRNVDLRALKFGKEVPGSGQVIRQTVELQSGLDGESAKEVTKAIKESKLKVQAEVQKDQVRVTGKKIDDLQAVIDMLKSRELKVPLQFVNMRR